MVEKFIKGFISVGEIEVDLSVGEMESLKVSVFYWNDSFWFLEVGIWKLFKYLCVE